MTTGVGTLLWTAPEVLRNEEYGTPCDVYRCGKLKKKKNGFIFVI